MNSEACYNIELAVVKLRLPHLMKSIITKVYMLSNQTKKKHYTFLSLRMRNVNVSKFQAQNIPLLLCSRVKFILHYLKKKVSTFPHIDTYLYIYIQPIRGYSTHHIYT